MKVLLFWLERGWIELGKYTEKDMARDTGSSSKDVARSGHDFRDHSGTREGKDSSHFKSSPSWAPEKTNSGISFSPSGRGPRSSDDSGK